MAQIYTAGNTLHKKRGDVRLLKMRYPPGICFSGCYKLLKSNEKSCQNAHKILEKKSPFYSLVSSKTTQKEPLSMETSNNFLHNLQVKLWQKTDEVTESLSAKEKKVYERFNQRHYPIKELHSPPDSSIT